jgi:2-polyprenyl-3-methyl-5-hydroxy-6-metoxy-1,4-benzoquinol methylase
MLEMWNNRYNVEEYVYGREPNVFFRNEIIQLVPGELLLPAEGEGRNAVFAAGLGWKTTAFDFSEAGRMKAMKLATENKVNIQYDLASFDNIDYKSEQFDCVALIYVHLPPDKRNLYFNKLFSYLKPGGTIIFEGYSKEQLKNRTGGPQEETLLYNKAELENLCKPLNEYDISLVDTELNEGLLHNGKSSLIRMTGSR